LRQIDSAPFSRLDALDENGRSGFRVSQKWSIFRVNLGVIRGMSAGFAFMTSKRRNGDRGQWTQDSNGFQGLVLERARAGLALMAVPVLGLDVAQPAQARGLTVLYNFADRRWGDPFASLIRDSAGNLYGTADYGGTAFAGAVFKVAPNESKQCCTASAVVPMAHNRFPHWRDKAHLYGTTTMGGSAMLAWCSRLDPGGTETVLHNFIGGTDGTTPTGGLLEDTAGQFYGTASQGGTSNAACCSR